MHVLCCQMSLGRDVLKAGSQTSKSRHFTGTRVRTIIARNIEYSMLFDWVLRTGDRIKFTGSRLRFSFSYPLWEVFLNKQTNKPPATALSHICQSHLMVWALPLCVTDSKGLKKGKRMKSRRASRDTDCFSCWKQTTYFSMGQQPWGFSTPKTPCHGLDSMQNWYWCYNDVVWWDLKYP